MNKQEATDQHNMILGLLLVILVNLADNPFAQLGFAIGAVIYLVRAFVK